MKIIPENEEKNSVNTKKNIKIKEFFAVHDVVQNNYLKIKVNNHNFYTVSTKIKTALT